VNAFAVGVLGFVIDFLFCHEFKRKKKKQLNLEKVKRKTGWKKKQSTLPTKMVKRAKERRKRKRPTHKWTEKKKRKRKKILASPPWPVTVALSDLFCCHCLGSHSLSFRSPLGHSLLLHLSLFSVAVGSLLHPSQNKKSSKLRQRKRVRLRQLELQAEEQFPYAWRVHEEGALLLHSFFFSFLGSLRYTPVLLGSV
jgi:hypothetical protein